DVRDFGGGFLRLLGQDPGAKHAHGRILVLKLRFLVLAAGGDAGRQMSDPNGGVGGVHRLSTGPRGAVDVDAQIVVVELDLLRFVDLGEDEDTGGGGVDAALGLGDRHALDPVHSAFELHPAVGAVVLGLDGHGDVLEPAEVG